MKRPWLVVVTVLALMAGACGGGGDSGEEAAAKSALVDEMVADGVSQDTAECFADKVIDEFGLAELQSLGEGNDPSSEDAMRILSLMTDCGFDMGGLSSGSSGDISDFRDLASPRDSVDGPYTYGDDAHFDELWDSCEQGSGTACDDLFFESPVGSEYEAFGNTCGNRLDLNYDCSSLGE